ncbi:MAG: ribose 5-phosphate isomerase B [Clostridia bacterium]|nr:ribose 5-phosphate isomerase B [Oscillospiraceae bacterium]MBQ7959797.1 ribose 5-phosphate isomerase B [Clostridia bacterium]
MIAIGCDHGGINLKEIIKKFLEEKGLEFKDFGTYSTDSCDYPDYAKAVCDAIVSGECEKGILVCGTGIGMSIAANKIDGIRAAHVTDTYSARMTKEHNDANIICLGERITGCDLALEIVNAYLCAEFQGGRHQKRIDKLMSFQK